MTCYISLSRAVYFCAHEDIRSFSDHKNRNLSKPPFACEALYIVSA